MQLLGRVRVVAVESFGLTVLPRLETTVEISHEGEVYTMTLDEFEEFIQYVDEKLPGAEADEKEQMKRFYQQFKYLIAEVVEMSLEKLKSEPVYRILGKEFMMVG